MPRGRADIGGDLQVTGRLTANRLADNLVQTPAIANGAVTIGKLSTRLVANGTITVSAGNSERVAISNPLPSGQQPPITHVLIRASSPSRGAVFSWSQGAITLSDGRHQQIVIFRNNEGGSFANIDVTYEIFALGE